MKVPKNLHVRTRAREQGVPVQAGNTQITDSHGGGAPGTTTAQPRLNFGGLCRATALRINWHKPWTGDQLSEKVCTGPKRYERLAAAYFGVVSIINNR